MNRSQWLLLCTCALSIYGVGNIWPVQTIREEHELGVEVLDHLAVVVL